MQYFPLATYIVVITLCMYSVKHRTLTVTVLYVKGVMNH